MDVEVVESRDGAAVVGVAVALVRVLVEHGAEVDEEEGAVKRVENGEGSWGEAVSGLFQAGGDRDGRQAGQHHGHLGAVAIGLLAPFDVLVIN